MGACESGLARASIGAEYIGLPSAMLSSGAQYVIGDSRCRSRDVVKCAVPHDIVIPAPP
jgi:hypothetical protein